VSHILKDPSKLLKIVKFCGKTLSVLIHKITLASCQGLHIPKITHFCVGIDFANGFQQLFHDILPGPLSPLNNGSNKTFVIQLHGKIIQNYQKFIRFSGKFDRIRHINEKELPIWFGRLKEVLLN
jgi:hypothetical protein